ncbi:U3 small nucleolar ribonucleoprotein IMP3 [Portunus trituberculatus]|uniref:U3 small nucleolar ribonucleoprotein IMP3 n=1 Tax=Portunus trituberculatus TaxID=210409 RepID=A0A5B7F6E0_PORTR|nr:U3 small nucleolar ribonucleoprotein IMP3 [Portunus trituberculatus]
MRQLKYAEKKLLKHTDFLKWEVDNNLHEVTVMKRYLIQRREDYTTRPPDQPPTSPRDRAQDWAPCSKTRQPVPWYGPWHVRHTGCRKGHSLHSQRVPTAEASGNTGVHKFQDG